ncbi:imidazole glycerol phosphate synthase subunit HisH [Candidatus Methylospira mobilis]|uniref:Imidazole glycerol phosphate synthase subunit HisH n=1 Tax=Candidatus Methylospira mobilis TaxID=1808979 RepID=A0A5Q0BKG8_9GAMM|nr:imidazole glycerol phosphate synthase subunit HisH [Candidatus Methylospira mobilis]QFY44415.1 imidazole glycerol phosphate synthase subunit HisH [Candidatus Methylospira mobilis]WNV06148.1 imidazole glycerol phosphate synthase subunit HisH [Candidatus Methylospira mobilis]
MSSVAIIDYGMGNLHSIAKAVQCADSATHVQVSSDPSVILAADRVVFPGVGAMRDCMAAVRERALDGVIAEAAKNKPLLGICLGMQALLDESEENGGTRGLGLISGKVARFPEGLQDHSGNKLKIPHMGWNRLHQSFAHPLWNGIAQETWFYFVHSYYVQPAQASVQAASSDYPEPFTAAVLSGNMFAVQFHPEKSQAAGLRLLSNFLTWAP